MGFESASYNLLTCPLAPAINTNTRSSTGLLISPSCFTLLFTGVSQLPRSQSHQAPFLLVTANKATSFNQVILPFFRLHSSLLVFSSIREGFTGVFLTLCSLLAQRDGPPRWAPRRGQTDRQTALPGDGDV